MTAHPRKSTASTGALSPYAVGEISRKYPTKITPAGGAFGIWGVIYTIQALFVIYQFWWPKADEAQLLHGVGFWYMSACRFLAIAVPSRPPPSPHWGWWARCVRMRLLPCPRRGARTARRGLTLSPALGAERVVCSE